MITAALILGGVFVVAVIAILMSALALGSRDDDMNGRM